jgi:hypothetical protein
MGELDELKQDIEDLREEIEELKDSSESSEEKETEDEPRILYIYIQHVVDMREFMGMEMEQREVLLLEDENSYHIPSEKEARYASTTRQVVEYLKALNIDCWENVKRLAEREEAVYYKAVIPSSVASEVQEGAWVKKAEASKLVDEMEPKEYL